MEKLLEVAKVKPVVNQVELHPLLAQRKLVGTCLRKVPPPPPTHPPNSSQWLPIERAIWDLKVQDASSPNNKICTT